MFQTCFSYLWCNITYKSLDTIQTLLYFECFISQCCFTSSYWEYIECRLQTGINPKVGRTWGWVERQRRHSIIAGGQKVAWMESTSPCNSVFNFSFKWRCYSLVWPKSLWQKPVFTTHLLWNRLFGCHLCNVQKHTLTVNRTKCRQSQSN